MDDLIKRDTLDAIATSSDATSQVFAQYMANIIEQIPASGDYNILQGTQNAQASFYFRWPNKDAINETLYNNLLSPRVQGKGAEFGVNQVNLAQSAFINAYQQLYLNLRYQLSQADKAIMQENAAAVAQSVAGVRAPWNAWVNDNSDAGVPKLDANSLTALVQITTTMTGSWLNPEFLPKLQKDRAYPYAHLNQFNDIFNKIPLSLPQTTVILLKEIYAKQGAVNGGITAKLANGVSVINAIQQAIANPSADNGASFISSEASGEGTPVPGLLFTPADPLALVTELKANPPVGTLKYSATITKSTDQTLKVEGSGGGGISIPIMDFFSVGVSGGASSSIFTENYVGSKFSVEIVVNNPTLQPVLTVQPKLYNVATGEGWMYVDPLKEAMKNGSDTNVSGYVFDGGKPPDFDYKEGGNFGYINTLLLSQFLELNLTFENCTSSEVDKYFEQHASVGISFLGIHLGGASESSSYSYSSHQSSDTKITVSLKPVAPGYTPGGASITESLCNLVAVGVEYPLA